MVDFNSVITSPSRRRLKQDIVSTVSTSKTNVLDVIKHRKHDVQQHQFYFVHHFNFFSCESCDWLNHWLSDLPHLSERVSPFSCLNLSISLLTWSVSWITEWSKKNRKLNFKGSQGWLEAQGNHYCDWDELFHLLEEKMRKSWFLPWWVYYCVQGRIAIWIYSLVTLYFNLRNVVWRCLTTNLPLTSFLSILTAGSPNRMSITVTYSMSHSLSMFS